MHPPKSILPAWLILSGASSAIYLGPLHPSPYDLSSDQSLVTAAWKNITAQIESVLNGIIDTGVPIFNNASFSLNAWSVNDPAASEALQYHHTGPPTRDSTNGTREVNSDSIYPVASVTKLMSVYIAKLALTDEMWSKPLSQVWPALSSQSEIGPFTGVNTTRWDEITAFHLASQISGLPLTEPIIFLSDITFALTNETELLAAGIPLSAAALIAEELAESTTVCTTYGTSCEDSWVGSHSWLDPIRPTFAVPGYSNNAFILFGLTLTRLTGKSLNELYTEYLSAPLNLDGTFVNDVDAELLNKTVIVNATNFLTLSFGNFSGSGGVKTSVNDMAKVGISILNSTLLSPVKTREWMKPVANTENLQYSVGAPWEISRVVSKYSGKVYDIYPKSGDSGDGAAYLVTIPDLNAGFNIALAYYSSNTTLSSLKIQAASIIADTLIDALIPAIEAQAEQEAVAKFSGIYTSSNINSSLTLAAGGPGYGLNVTEWISNGTDLCASPLHPLLACPFQLQPTDDRRDPNTGIGQVLFHAPILPVPPVLNAVQLSATPFTNQWALGEWVQAPGYAQVGGINVDTFVFTTGMDGEAQSVIPSGLRITLDKQAEL